MPLSIERLRNVIKFDSPKGLRNLLSEYIRLSCLLEIHKTSLLDIRLELNKMTKRNIITPSSNEKMHVDLKISKTRGRSLTQTQSKLGDPSSLLMTGDMPKHPLRRSRSHSAKAAYV